MLSLVILLVETINNYKKKQKMYGIDSVYMNSKDFIRNNKFFKKYYKLINTVLTERDKERYAPVVFYAVLISAIAMMIYFISIKQLFFAVIAPVSLYYVTNKIFTLLLTDVNEKVDEQLPYTIDTIIKVFSKYSDLKSVIYEVSQMIEDPLKSRFERLARKMISENQEKALMDFADEMDNIWIYSMVFILLSYKEEAKKEDVVANLRHLSNIIERENNLQNASVTDKKYGVVLNYAIAIIAGIGGIANIVFNPVGKEFFFGSMLGIICIIVGYACIALTIIINIKLASKKGKKV